MLLLTTPLPLLAAFLLVIRRPPDALSRLAVHVVACTLIFFALPGVPVYDSVRQAIFLFPFLIYLLVAGIGRWPPRWRTLLLAALLLANLSALAAYFPHEASYYNGLAGGLAGAVARGYDATLYGNDLTPEFLAWLNAHLPENARVAAAPFNLRTFKVLREHGLLRRDLDFIAADRPPEFLILQQRGAFFTPRMQAILDRETPLYAVRSEGVILAAVYRLGPEP